MTRFDDLIENAGDGSTFLENEFVVDANRFSELSAELRSGRVEIGINRIDQLDVYLSTLRKGDDDRWRRNILLLPSRPFSPAFR